MAVKSLVRIVNLYGGPYDGHRSVTSCETAYHGGEIYVWNGDKERVDFSPLESFLRDGKDQDAEFMNVFSWMVASGAGYQDLGLDLVTGVSPQRVNAWIVALQNNLAFALTFKNKHSNVTH